MRSITRWKPRTILLLGGALTIGMMWLHSVQAGGPLIIGGGTAGFGPDGQAFTWSTAAEIQYNTDGPASGSALGNLTQAQADARVVAMFDVWENVSTAVIGYNLAGTLTGSGFDGDVDTVSEYNDFTCGGANISQNPIIYDVDGSLFTSLGFSSSTIGFAGPCGLNGAGTILNGRAALNGIFQDGNMGNGELSVSEFDAAFIHEFGHFSGLDHSQINLNCLTMGCANFSADTLGLPTMFPILLGGLEESAGVAPPRTLAQDDIAWISKLYPSGTFNSNFGTISGVIFFSDSTTHAQGVNVIAREGGAPRVTAVSVISGFRFTGNPGQSLSGTNTGGSPFGSRTQTLIGVYEISVPPGSYTVEVETISSSFTGGSSVGPLDPPIPSPGPAEFFDNGESSTDTPGDSNSVVVSAGGTVPNIDIVLNGTAAALDSLEPNDSLGSASSLAEGTTSALSISPFGDEDFYSFTTSAGTNVSVEITAERLSSPSRLDSILEIVDGIGTRLNTCRGLGTADPFTTPCFNDDLGGTVDSGLEFQVPGSGMVTFFVHVLDFRGDGRPDFQYELSLSTTPGGGGGGSLASRILNRVAQVTPRWRGGSSSLALTSDSIRTRRTPILLNDTQQEASIPSRAISGVDMEVPPIIKPISHERLPTVLMRANGPVASTKPLISSLSLGVIERGEFGFVLTVMGSGFVSESVVRWNGSPLKTKFVDGNELRVAIPAEDIVKQGAAKVTVLNPGVSERMSNVMTFTSQSETTDSEDSSVR